MKRLMVNGAIGLCLLLWLAVMGLWIDSYWYRASLSRTNSHQLRFISYGGSIDMTFNLDDTAWWPRLIDWSFFDQWEIEHQYHRPEYRYEYEEPSFLRFDWYAYGFGAMKGDSWNSGSAIHFPHWFLAMLLMAFPVIVVRSRLVGRAGHCRHCDYDLTGNTTGKCPECGGSVSDRLPPPSEAPQAPGRRKPGPVSAELTSPHSVV